ncbi:MAG: hypothetical protein ACLFOA_03810 [Desulfohalobiaceae bacterium]
MPKSHMPSISNELIHALTQEIGTRLNIVHHIPGRIRLKFDTSLASHPLKEEFKNLAINMRPLHIEHISRWSRSVLITYDPQTIAPELLDELFTAPDVQKKQNALLQLGNILASGQE